MLAHQQHYHRGLVCALAALVRGGGSGWTQARVPQGGAFCSGPAVPQQERSSTPEPPLASSSNGAQPGCSSSPPDEDTIDFGERWAAAAAACAIGVCLRGSCMRG
jgi:hypothetical protein